MKKSFAIIVLALGVLIGCAGRPTATSSTSTSSTSTSSASSAVTLANHAIPGGALLPSSLPRTTTAQEEGWHIVPEAYAQTTTQPQIVMSFDGFCAAVNTYVDGVTASNIASDTAESGDIVYGLGSLNNQSGKCFPAPGAFAAGQGAPVAGAGTLSTFRIYGNGGGNAVVSIFINGQYVGSPCTLVQGQNIGTCDPSASYPVNDGDYVEATIVPPTLADVQALANIHILFGKS